MSAKHADHTAIRQAVTDGVGRALAAVGLCGVALIHLLDVTGKFQETPYMGWMYVGLIAACLGLAGALVGTSDTRVWAAAAVLPALVLIGFVLSRTTGLPQADGDIGNWSEPLGMASLFVEGSLVALGGGMLLSRAAAGKRSPARATRRPDLSRA